MKRNLTGKRVGSLLIQEVHSRSRNGHIRWRCKCDCGGQHDVLSTHLITGKVTHCGCEKVSGRKQKQWNGCGDISGNLWYCLQRGANGSKSRRVINFEITIECAWELFLSQGKRCALSNEPLCFEHEDGVRVRDFRTASLDRIDSSEGYVEGNVQWVHKDINLMKGRLNESVFLEWCIKVASSPNDTLH